MAVSEGPGGSAGKRPSVMLVYNTMLYIARLRRELIAEFQQLGYDVIAVAPTDDARETLEQLKVRCIDWPLVGHSINPLRELRSLFALFAIMRRVRPNHVLLFTIKPIVYGTLVARCLRIRSVYAMVTGLGLLFSPGSMALRLVRVGGSWIYRLALRGNAAVFVQNAEHERLLVASGYCLPSRLVRIHGSGVSLRDYRPRDPAETPAPAAAPTFLLAARLLRHKGILEYLAAAKMVVRARPQCRFLLAGGFVQGPSAIDEKTLQAALQDTPVQFLGEVDDIAAWMAKSSAFVLPSRYPEGVPRVLLEALACGLALITTDTAGCRETVNPGENGLLIAASADSAELVEAIGEAMLWLCDNPDRRSQMGFASRRLAERKFDVNDVNDVILSTMAVKQPRLGAAHHSCA